MSASSERAILSALERATRALDQASQAQQLPGTFAGIRLGTVTDVTDGWHTVGLVNPAGGIVESLPGLRVWGAGEYIVGDKVAVAFIGANPVPVILSGGAGEGGTSVAVIGGGFLGYLTAT